MKPFYFGDRARRLYGVHHAPRGSSRRAGVVVCPPFGQEALRAHRALRELAHALAGAGFHALRFDLSDTGDSAGDGSGARLDTWREDVGVAIDEMREMTDSASVILVGLRLGGTLATLAAGRPDVEALVLWDPVASGARHLAELRAAHAAWLDDHAPGAAHGDGEVLGFPLSRELAADLAAVDLEGAVPAQRRVLLASTDASGRLPGLWPEAPGVTRRRFEAAPVWLHAEGMDSALVPGELVAGVASWLCEVGP